MEKGEIGNIYIYTHGSFCSISLFFILILTSKLWWNKIQVIVHWSLGYPNYV